MSLSIETKIRRAYEYPPVQPEWFDRSYLATIRPGMGQQEFEFRSNPDVLKIQLLETSQFEVIAQTERDGRPDTRYFGGSKSFCTEQVQLFTIRATSLDGEILFEFRNRIPVLSFGSNIAPGVLFNKFRNQAQYERITIPALSCSVPDLAVIHAGAIMGTGGIMAGIFPYQGAVSRAMLTFLPADLTKILSGTEPNYNITEFAQPVTLGNGQVITNVIGYSCIWGALRDPVHTDRPMALAKIPIKQPSSESKLRLVGQAEPLEIVRKKTCPDMNNEDFILRWAVGDGIDYDLWEEREAERVKHAIDLQNSGMTIGAPIMGRVLKPAPFFTKYETLLSDGGFKETMPVITPEQRIDP